MVSIVNVFSLMALLNEASFYQQKVEHLMQCIRTFYSKN